MLKLINVVTLLLCSSGFAATLQLEKTTPDMLQVRLTPDKGEIVLQETVTLTTNNPAISVVSWESLQQPTSFFHTPSQRTLLGYDSPTVFQIKVQRSSEPCTEPVDLFIQYATNKQTASQERRITISCDTNTAQTAETGTPSSSGTQAESSEQEKTSHSFMGRLTAIGSLVVAAFERLTTWVTERFSATNSTFGQICIALFLGICMSLTPCIYPMIPITVGILGTSAQQSTLRNFFLAFSYSLGLATTFALFGFFTTFFGVHFGELLGNPVFVVLLVAFLVYLAGTMFGWYEMRIPRFLQPRQKSLKGGSHLSAFLLGAMSGTIASPCMSPGLALLLTVAAKSGSYLFALSMLFMFGLGASLPLLIVGTFSSSLNVLPRAGIWMIEFKKLFGFLLLGVSIGYLKILIPVIAYLALMFLLFAAATLYYLRTLSRAQSWFGMEVSFVLALGCLVGTGTFGYRLYQTLRPQVSSSETTQKESAAESSQTLHWRTDYDAARAEALAQNKVLLLDFGAEWCPSCVALENKLLHQPGFLEKLSQVPGLILIKIDGTRRDSYPYAQLVHTEFKDRIRGIPALLLVKPLTDGTHQVLGQWGGEISFRPDEFITDLAQASKNV